MKKYLIIFLILLSTPCFAAFDFFERFSKNKTAIYLAPYNLSLRQGYDEPLHSFDTFRAGSKIYFMVFNDKGFKSQYIRYQIVKQDDNAHVGGYSRIHNITVRVNDRNSYYDYFVLNKAGKYFIQVFDIENLQQWLAIAAFRVVDD